MPFLGRVQRLVKPNRDSVGDERRRKGPAVQRGVAMEKGGALAWLVLLMNYDSVYPARPIKGTCALLVAESVE